MYASAMTTTTAEKPANLGDLTRLQDPRDQLKRAAQVIRESEEAIEPHRLRRNAAAVIIYRNGQDVGPGEAPMQPAAMWRDTIQVSRSLWRKVTIEASPGKLAETQAELAEKRAEIAELTTDRAAEPPKLVREEAKLAHRVERSTTQIAAIEQMQAEIDADPSIGEQLLTIAREEGEVVRRLELLIDEAKRTRDRIAFELLDGTHGTPPSNIEIGKWAGLSSARVAQLRGARFVR